MVNITNKKRQFTNRLYIEPTRSARGDTKLHIDHYKRKINGYQMNRKSMDDLIIQNANDASSTKRLPKQEKESFDLNAVERGF